MWYCGTAYSCVGWVDEPDLAQAGAAGGAHGFGDTFIAAVTVGFQVQLDIAVLGDGIAEAGFELLAVNRFAADEEHGCQP